MPYTVSIYIGSFKVICQGLREMAVSKAMLSKGDSKIAVDAAHSLDGPHSELMAVINEVASEIHGHYVLKSSQDDPFRFFSLPRLTPKRKIVFIPWEV